MQKFLSTVVFFLMSLPVLAATEEVSKADAPVETVGTIYIVIFGIIFIGMIVGFFAYLMWGEKDKKPDQ